MNAAVFGLGFVGLTTALGFAHAGIEVHGFDVDRNRRTEIIQGRLPFMEPGLGEALQQNLNTKFFIEESVTQKWLKDVDVCLLCVGTPGATDGSADLSYITSVIDSVFGLISDDCVLVVKSTVPPGTTQSEIEPYIRSKGMRNPIAVNPEFLREGHCWKDFTNPDRIVCGVAEDNARRILGDLYKPFGAPVHFVTFSTAEFIKYLSNALLATLISYSNEMAQLAETIGNISVSDAFHILHQDHRLSGSGINTYIYPGCGYGGYCLPKDTVALSAAAKAHSFQIKILDEVISTNLQMPNLTAKRIIRHTICATDKIGILGLSFKPGSNDVRDSSAAKIITEMIEAGYKNIYAYDPVANAEFEQMYRLPISYCTSVREVCEVCDIIAVVTAWPEFKTIKHTYPEKTWIDCRYFLED